MHGIRPLLFLLLFPLGLGAQVYQTLPETQRYLHPIFPQVEKQTDIYAIKKEDTLSVDVYSPVDDTLKKRPLVLYVHGGGFQGGRRDDPLSERFAKQLARRGFVVASISYRLTMRGQSFSCDQPTPNKIRTFQLAVEDIRSATNFLLDLQQSYCIDTKRIVLAGSSAGAEAVLHAAYWTESDLLDSTPTLPDGFRYAGVVSFAGAMVSDTLITGQNALPMALFHGTCDGLVPYGTAPHHYCSEESPGYLVLHGGYRIAERLRALGKSYYLLSHCGGGHEWASQPMLEQVPAIVLFLKEQVVEGQFQQLHYRYKDHQPCIRVKGLPFCRGADQ